MQQKLTKCGKVKFDISFSLSILANTNETTENTAETTTTTSDATNVSSSETSHCSPSSADVESTSKWVSYNYFHTCVIICVKCVV